MLGELKDRHVWIEYNGEIITTYSVPHTVNWNPAYVQGMLESQVKCGEFAIVGRLKGSGFGYLALVKQSAATEELAQDTVRAVQALSDAPGFIVDLRGANGGSETLSSPIASAFCGADVVYATHKRRSGPGHNDFGPVRTRTLDKGENPYMKPVVVLIGQRCMSSGEALVQMFSALPNVTTVGERTRGASGNPAPVDLPGLPVKVWFSRWVDMMPDGSTFEGKGIAPDVNVSFPPAAYAQGDPTLVRGIVVLREQVSNSKSPLAPQSATAPADNSAPPSRATANGSAPRVVGTATQPAR